MTGWLLRAGVLATGLGCSAMAWQLWAAGQPPLWSFAADRVETIVVRAEVSDEAAPGGRNRRLPHVHVAWPPGAASAVEIGGLPTAHDFWGMRTAEEVMRRHAVGSRVIVRNVGGLPMADRTDLRELGWALTASLLALALTAAGLALAGGRLRDKGVAAV